MLSFSLTLLTVLSNRRMANSMVTEKVTVMARMTMVSIIPTEIFLFIGASYQPSSIRMVLPSSDSASSAARTIQAAR